jgi:hypothetical protein
VAIINGRRVYDSRKLAAVAALEDRAAAEYVWMMAGISDDWGRFRASARMILGTAYKDRAGVTEEDVERWLGLYNTVFESMGEYGLLRFYYHDGVRYAEWTNYMGDPPSQREHHNCPEPEWSTHKHGKGCKFWGPAKLGVPLKPTRKSKPAGTSKKHLSVPSVPPDPVVTETELRLTPPSPAFPSARAADAFRKFYPQGTPPQPMFKALRPLVLQFTWDRVGPELDAYLARVPIEYHNWVKFASGFGRWTEAPQIRGKPATADNARVLDEWERKIREAVQ